MIKPLGTYSFLPWLRQGIAGTITDQDLDPNVHRARATVHVELALTGERLAGGTPLTVPIDRDIELFGPGDVVGIDRRAIVRREPRDWITNFEPNYLVHLEFNDEDFPWRYTPTAPDPSGLRLRPWIALIVLQDGEFEDGGNTLGKALPYIDVGDLSILPPANELWAWAHVHVNRSLAANDDEFTSTNMAAVVPRLRAVLAQSADLAYSRIVCPRRLKANAAYHAFLVPTFETGRLAALGLDPSVVPSSTTSAWAAYPGRRDSGSLPVYHRWYFRTSSEGDFEFLVRLLKPRPMDKRVGVRDVDVRRPGSGLPGIDDADLGGVLKLGGALRVPRSSFTPQELQVIDRYENWSGTPPHPFQSALAGFVNLADDYAVKPAQTANADSKVSPEITGEPDPLITAPIYARWHALTQRLLVDRDGDPLDPDDNWVHELNLDPRHRLAAGFGTRVVQERQEEYMLAAWEQIGEVLEANRRIRLAQLAKQVSAIWHAVQLAPLARARPERAVVLTAPVQARVRAGDITVRQARRLSLAPPALTSAPMRRMTRPRARLMRLLPFDADVRPDNLLERVLAGEVSAAPPKTTPPGVVTTDEIADAIVPDEVPSAIADAIRRRPWLVWLPLVLALLVLLLVLVLVVLGVAVVGVLVVGALLILALLAAWRVLARWAAAIDAAQTISEESLTEEAVDELPQSPDFVITEPGPVDPPRRGGSDSVQAQRFKIALRDWHVLHGASATASAEPAPVRIDLGVLAGATIAGIDPSVTIPRRTLHGISLPAHVVALLDLSDFGEVMAYPEIDVPMYKPLTELSKELFLPNINAIPQNTISLLETNQKFIESYLVGLNTEFGRELLWREFPTDQRGSYFRQFWDPRGAMTPPGTTPEQRRELLRDIPEINRWTRRSGLGDHDHRERPGDNEEEVVLVIRGELLKKYPNAVIYAQLARWGMTNGHVDPNKERELPALSEAQERDPTLLKTPLYEAKVDPDITFFGFDLTVTEARGESGDSDSDNPGWFFVIKERPGEPRMGFDISRESGEPIQTVNDLAWSDAGTAEHGYVPATALANITLAGLGTDDMEKNEQRDDDLNVIGAPVSAARWAYLLYQVPVLVAVHATEMLADPDA